MDKKKYLISGVVLGLTLLLTSCTDSLGTRYVSFAQCVTSKGATMYGAYWCPHCANQKKMFGSTAFKEINYVECDPRGAGGNPQLCQQKGVEGYPTWIFADGSKTQGELTLEQIAEKTTCELPPPKAK